MSRVILLVVLLFGLAPQVLGQGISGSVGEGGRNRADDVLWVQKVLNQVPSVVGGPLRPLVEDSKFGPNTAAAIKRFQKIQLAFADGLIEPSGRTFQRLSEFVDFAGQDRSGDPLVWGAIVTGPFKAKVIAVAKDLQLDPNFLMAAMAFETGETFSPAIKNAAGSGATGLIQFMPETAKRLGTSTDDLAKMTAVDQLDFVKKYFSPYRGKLQTVADVYMAILWPKAVGQPDDFVLFEKEQGKVYDQNKGLDLNRDGKITKREAAEKVQKKLEKGSSSELKK